MTRHRPVKPMNERRPTHPAVRTLNARQQRFVAEFIACQNGSEAARRAGYSARTANRASASLLTNVVISRAIAQGTAAALKKADLSAARVLEELRRLAFVDVTGVFTDAGNLRPFSEWTAEQRAALAGFEVVIKNAAAGDGHTDTVHKVKLSDKVKALDLLARHFALLHDQVTIEGDWDKFAARLASAKLRRVKREEGKA